MKLSRDENQLIRDENRQLRDNLKDFKTQLLDAIATRLDKFNEDTNTRLDKISGTTNTQFDKAAKDSKAAFAKAAKESKAGLDKATVMITSCLNNLLKMVRPLQGFLSVSERKQENRIIGLVNRKKGGDAWVPLQDVNDNATINDVTSMSVLNKTLVTDLEKYTKRVGYPKEILPQRNRDKVVEVVRAIWGGEL